MSHADYQSLIERLADAEPHSGYTHVGSLELTDADDAEALARRWPNTAGGLPGEYR